MSHLENCIPGIVEESMIFIKILETAAKNSKTLKLGESFPVTSQYVIFADEF